MVTPDELRARAALYRSGGPSSEHTATMLEGAAAAIEWKQAQYEMSQRYWVDAAQKALAGDTKDLRLRVDMAHLGPTEITEA